MKKILLLTFLLFSLIESKAQGVWIRVKTYATGDSVNMLYLKPISRNGDSIIMMVQEAYNKVEVRPPAYQKTTMDALPVLYERDFDTSKGNIFLSPWGIICTGRIDD